MSMRERRLSGRTLLAGTGLVIALATSGCGGAIPSSQGGSTMIEVAQSKLGRFLVDESGHTLYLFAKDEPRASRCDGACASVWPPVETDGALAAGSGVSRARLGTIKRADGGLQVTYSGHPLYYYAGDASNPRATYGQAISQFGAEWYLVSPAGKAVGNVYTGTGSKGGGSGKKSGGGGY